MKQKIKNFFTLNRRSNGGFTLVELVVVIAILAILAGAAVPAYSGYINKANEAADQQLLAAMNTAYASACAAEGESHIGRGDVPTTIQLVDKKVPTELIGDPAINGNFNLFFQGGQFKRFTELGFNAAKGVFVSDVSEAVKGWLSYIWGQEGNPFAGKEDKLLELFDITGGMLGVADGLTEGDIDEYLDLYLGNCSDDFLDATGLGGIFGDLFSAMDINEEEYIEAYKEAYKKEHGEYPGENEINGYITTVKGNKAVMLFAQEAAEANADEVKSDVTDFMNIVKNATNMAWVAENLPEEYNGNVNAYVADYMAANPEKEGQLMKPEMAALVSLAAEKAGTTNSTGVNTLGSLYALSAGYLAQTGGDMSKAGMFDTFVNLVATDGENFLKYYDDCGDASVDAYLAFAGALSQGGIEEAGSFEDLGDYINGIVGGNG